MYYVVRESHLEQPETGVASTNRSERRASSPQEPCSLCVLSAVDIFITDW